MKKPSLFTTIYVAILTLMLGYYGYCGYTGRRLLEFSTASQWSPSGNSGFHHK